MAADVINPFPLTQSTYLSSYQNQNSTNLQPLSDQDVKVNEVALATLMKANELQSRATQSVAAAQKVLGPLKAGPSGEAAAPKPLDLAMLEALQPHIDLAERRIMRYITDIDTRRQKAEKLEKLNQHLRNSQGDIDWTNDVEKQELIQHAMDCGAVICLKDGKHKWTQAEKDIMLLNVEKSIDPLLSSNEKDKTMLGWHQNKMAEYSAALTNLLKKHSDLIMDVIRSMR